MRFSELGATLYRETVHRQRITERIDRPTALLKWISRYAVQAYTTPYSAVSYLNDA